ncbi:hypothetical protein [Halosolutus gelatinilyticus]|uniref:hypothetical protein n=1 Tax=Halosolutus gelatinilyticus TaxID=2931975 RepID=UPI001FF59D7E|nr:hypothetical protein [Halosolutus gelatinilyticus]
MSDEEPSKVEEERTEDETVAGEPTEPSESLLLTYAAPFFGVLLIAAGVPLAILGGYVVVQDAFDLCGDPDIEVRALEDGEQPGQTVETVEFDRLTPAEQEAIREAIDSPLGEAPVQDERMENQGVLSDGAIVTVDGDRYYVRIASVNSCLQVRPLLFPIGSVAILVGIAGVLTPPIYRKMAGFEERMQRGRRR